MPVKKKTVSTPAKKKVAKKAAKKVVAKKKATKSTAKKSATKKGVKKVVTTAKKTVKKSVKKVAKKKVKSSALKVKTEPKAEVKTQKPKAKKSKAIVKSAKKTSKKVTKPKVKEVVKKSRKMKMTPFIRKQRQRLLDLRDVMVDTTQGITRDTLHSSSGGNDSSGSGMHTGDAGSDAYDKDLALNILSKETNALHEIEEALLRIENKTYGICEMSGADIPEVRLEALPFCRLTIECQTQLESKSDYGKKRSDAVGYGR